MNCLIIDDEPLARQLIKTFVSRKTSFVIVGECTNPSEAYELLLNNDIDVIFLDIQMPVLSGIDFLKTLKRPPAIIFTTAYANHAATAFDLNVVDYIVKPVTEERFEQAINKLHAALRNKLENVNKETGLSPTSDHAFFKVEGRLVKVMFADIRYLEAQKDFTRMFIKDQQPLLIGEHLKAVEALLPPNDFVRIHRSYSVSVTAISGIFGNTVEIGKTQLPVGISYKEGLIDRLNIH